MRRSNLSFDLACDGDFRNFISLIFRHVCGSNAPYQTRLIHVPIVIILIDRNSNKCIEMSEEFFKHC